MESFRQILSNIISNLSSGVYPNNLTRWPPNNTSNSSRNAHQRSGNRPPDIPPSSSTGYNTRSRSCSQPRSHPNHQPAYTRNHSRSNAMNRADSTTQTASRAGKGEEKIDIKDIRDVSEINSLGAKQLKTILARNCVDYKGIFEKEVLREKVMLLWIDHNENVGKRRVKQSGATQRSQDDLSDISDDQVCKICMEREINCVLLDCGHLVTCVDCGKKLAECPICRQNIVRVARTFRV